MEEEANQMINKVQTIEEKINQRQRQILVHSIIYYNLDENIVDDYTWTKWAEELIELQRKYPKTARHQKYGEIFADFTTPSGHALPLDDPDANAVAKMLLNYRDERYTNV